LLDQPGIGWLVLMSQVRWAAAGVRVDATHTDDRESAHATIRTPVRARHKRSLRDHYVRCLSRARKPIGGHCEDRSRSPARPCWVGRDGSRPSRRADSSVRLVRWPAGAAPSRHSHGDPLRRRRHRALDVCDDTGPHLLRRPGRRRRAADLRRLVRHTRRSATGGALDHSERRVSRTPGSSGLGTSARRAAGC